MLFREPTTIPFSTAALKANLLRLENEWEAYQVTRERDAVYIYLTVVFDTVMAWAKEGKAVKCAHRALHLRGHDLVREPEPFAAVIFCTSDPDKVDERARSKWSRVLRYAAEFKDLDEPLRVFIKRKGGINECAARFARRLGPPSAKTDRTGGCARPCRYGPRLSMCCPELCDCIFCSGLAARLHRWGDPVAADKRYCRLPGSVRLLRPCRDENLRTRL